VAPIEFNLMQLNQVQEGVTRQCSNITRHCIQHLLPCPFPGWTRKRRLFAEMKSVVVDDGRKRVVIENVKTGIDGGPFPAMQVVGENKE
jgi:hypothetical protein